MDPIGPLDAEQLAARMPESAKKDLLEWAPLQDAAGYLRPVVTNGFPVANYLDPDPNIQVTDDRPYNEYFLLRRME
jgi:hypothetical protein